jgi:hypothetical protein
VGTFIRFSDTEGGALKRALAAEHPVAARRPALSEWIRDLIIAHSSQVLGVEITRGGLQHAKGGVADWKRWRLARAVQSAAGARRRRRVGSRS